MKLRTTTALTLILTCMISVTFSIIPVEAKPDIIYVPGDHSTIQAAINAASDNDTIYVSSGTYPGSIIVNKSLALIGQDPDTTVIQGTLGEEYVLLLQDMNYVNISGFTITGSKHGISLDNSNNNVISGNNITGNSEYGVFLRSSSNNHISNNAVSHNTLRGIYLRENSNDNTVNNNAVSHHTQWGFYLYHSRRNIISNNTVSNNVERGIYMIESNNNTFSGNTVSDNTYGISIRDSRDIVLRNNNMTSNIQNFDVIGDYTHNIDDSNTINGKPMYYWVNQHDKQIPAGAGYVAAINSANIIVKNQNLANNTHGVLFINTENSTIANVNTSYNQFGIFLRESGNNIIDRNVVARNYKGIELEHSSGNNFTNNLIMNNSYGAFYVAFSLLCNNTFYHNNFINNTNQVGNSSISTNIWDNGYPSGGNYWSDYAGVDDYSGVYQNELGSDGIGDTPRVINTDNQDNYPLMTPVSILVVDQVILSDNRCDVGTPQTIFFHAKWLNGSDVSGGIVYVNDTEHTTNSTGWTNLTVVYDTIGKHAWTITESDSFSIIWDRVKIVDGGVSRAETEVTETETVWFEAVYEYDSAVFDGTKGTLYVNGSAMTWSASEGRWEHNYTFNTSGKRAFKISSVNDSQYNLTVVNDAVGAQSITWKQTPQMPWVLILGISAAAAVILAIFLMKAKKTKRLTGSVS